MGEAVALPASGALLTDARGGGRWLRTTWHPEAGVVVLSLWQQDTCVATFRVPREQVPALVAALSAGLAT